MDFSPKRVVCLQPSATVVLHELGLLDRVVACTKYCADVVPGADNRGRLIIHDSWTAHSDQIRAAKPDLVIASVPYQEQAVIEILKSGVKFLGLAPKSLADVYGDITSIAGIMNHCARGARMVRDMQEEIMHVRDKLHRVKTPPKVYCEEWGKPLIRAQQWVAELVGAAGGSFVGEPGSKPDPKQVLAEDPDVVVLAWCGAGDRVPLEKIVKERGWERMKAVRDNRVYCVRDELLNTPAPTLMHGLHALAWAIHPEVFRKPRGIHRLGEAQR